MVDCAPGRSVPAILADPIAASLGTKRTWESGAFSMSLLICALLAPRVGRFIDRRGGRGVLALSAIVLSAGLLALAAAGGRRRCSRPGRCSARAWRWASTTRPSRL